MSVALSASCSNCGGRMSSMEHHSGHAHHGHGHHAHDVQDHKKHHGHVAHGTPDDLRAAYKRAYEEAQPAPGRQVVSVDLAAGEFDWEFSPGRRTRAWGL